MVVADQALADAGIDSSALSTEQQERIGVIYGSGIGGLQGSVRSGSNPG